MKTTSDIKGHDSSKVANSEKAAYAAGGAIAGAGITAGIDSAATPDDNIDTISESESSISVDQETDHISQSTDQNTTAHKEVIQEVPDPGDVIVATSDGIRVAQVNDDLSFSRAFTEARQQVGAGGVFEWRGRIYSTFYKDEWDGMSSQEKAEWQHSIDYDEVRQEDNNYSYTKTADHSPHIEIHAIERNVDGTNTDIAYASVDGHDAAFVDENQDGYVDAIGIDVNDNGFLDDNEVLDARGERFRMPSNVPEMDYANSSEEPVVEVLGVEHNVNINGETVDAAIVRIDDQEALLVDINQDGYADVVASDFDGDGLLDESEIADLKGTGTLMPGADISETGEAIPQENFDPGLYTI